MQEGEKCRLKEKVERIYDKKPKVYGSKNDEVIIISISEPAVIVEHCKTKERFTTNIDNLKSTQSK